MGQGSVRADRSPTPPGGSCRVCAGVDGPCIRLGGARYAQVCDG
jgi:hypothetical protein